MRAEEGADELVLPSRAVELQVTKRDRGRKEEVLGEIRVERRGWRGEGSEGKEPREKFEVVKCRQVDDVL